MFTPLVITLLAPVALASRFAGINQLANNVVAAEDSDVTACAVAEVVLSVCVNEIPDFTDAPAVTQEACLCCLSTINIASSYGVCADYITSSATKYSEEYSLFTDIAQICDAEAIGFCGAGQATATGTGGSLPTASPSLTITSSRPGCTSLASMLSSCSRKIPGFTTAADSEVAECVCFQGSSYTTRFDNYASSCASNLKTQDTSAYSVIAPLSTFCVDNKDLASPTTSSRPTSSRPTTAAPQSTVTVDSNGNPVSTTAGRAAAPRTIDGPLAWFIGAFTFILSTLFML